MKIRRLQIAGFGKLNGRLFDFPAQLNLVVGANEAGKTTLINCIIGVLYGFRRQKRLQERYIPWGGGEYQAALTLADDKGREYIVGRDFYLDRVKVYRSESKGLFLEDEDILQNRILAEAGLANPNLFESTLFIRQAEMANLSQDKISEAINKKITASADEVSAREALRRIENALKDYTRKGQVNPGILTEAERLEEGLNRQYLKLKEHYMQYDRKVREKTAAEFEAAQKESRLAIIAPLLEQYRKRQALLGQKRDLDRKLAEAVEKVVQIDNLQKKQAVLEEELKTLGKVADHLRKQGGSLDEVHVRLHEIDLERRVKQEQRESFSAEMDDLQKELEQTRQKLAAYDKEKYNPEKAVRVSYLEQSIREKRVLLVQEERQREIAGLELIDGGPGRMMKYMAVLALNVMPAVFYCLAASEYIDLRLPSRLLPGAAGILALVDIMTLWGVVRTMKVRAGHRLLERKIAALTGDIEERNRELIGITGGEDPENYMQNMEKVRLLQNDLWHLEHTLALKNAEGWDGEFSGLVREEQNLKDKRDKILAELACADEGEYRGKVDRYKELIREKRVLQEKMELLLAGKSLDACQGEKISLAAESARVEALLDEVRIEMSLDEVFTLDQEYRNLQEEIRALREKITEYHNDIKNYHELVLPKDSQGIQDELAEARARTAKNRFTAQALELALRILQEASDEVTNKVGPELEKNAVSLLSHMTSGKYKAMKLRVTREGLDLYVKAPEREALAGPDDLSTGTKDQIYLSVRIALALSILGGAKFPIFLDDPFVHFDDDRLRRTIHMLVSLSRVFQIIWLSKDESLCGRLPGANVIRM
ncbi:MAG: ATP-binding protein [Bacillota bacterium]